MSTVKDYKKFIQAENKKRCPTISGKKKADLKRLAESIGYKEPEKKAPAKKAPAKKAPAKKAVVKKEAIKKPVVKKAPEKKKPEKKKPEKILKKPTSDTPAETGFDTSTMYTQLLRNKKVTRKDVINYIKAEADRINSMHDI